jgi:hypothetical protein
MEIFETAIATFLFALIFLFGNRLEGVLGFSRRRVISAAAGVSIAYVFMRMLPELNEAGRAFVDATAHRTLPFPELRIYTSALLGFILFYGLEHLVKWSRVAGRKNTPGYGGGDPVFLLHIGGFAVYGWLVAYLIVRSISDRPLPILLYALAMGLHFLSVDHSLGREHGDLYSRPGKQILAGGVLAGWICGVLAEFPKPVVITLLGLVSGGVIMNSMIMELPTEKEGNFWAFGGGAGAYAVLLAAIG